jgi:hypothetical protein
MTNNIYIQIDGEKIKAEGQALEQLLLDKANFEEEEQAKAQAEAEATAKKAAAESKLAALGLTTDDLKALGL